MRPVSLEPIRPFRRESAPVPRGFQPLGAVAGRLEIEIGCGTGLHPLRLAFDQPDSTVIAIEHTHERFNKFARRIQNHGHPPNLIPVHANAISWITHALGASQVDRYWLLYPNPHPRTRDRRQRWHAMPFFERLIETLKPGGEFVLATNLRWYADEAELYLRRHWGMSLKSRRELTTVDRDPPRTAFERKYLERGETCWDLRFESVKT